MILGLLPYLKAIKLRSALGQAARKVVEHRFEPINTTAFPPNSPERTPWIRERWGDPSRLDANFAAVTLVFQDGSTITESEVSEHGTLPPGGHSELRALILAVNMAIT
jgi:hypothetical protein